MTLILGWTGTLLYLLNHAYISLYINWKERIYYIGNLIAALCLVVSSYSIQSWQPVITNCFWAIVSLCSLYSISLDRCTFSKKIFELVLLLFIGCTILICIYSTAVGIIMFAWSSVYVFCSGYLLFTAKRLSPRTFLLYNTYAAFAITPKLVADTNYPVLILEICWAVISLYGVFNLPNKAKKYYLRKT